MKKILLVCALLLSWNAGAKEVGGFKLDDTVQIDKKELVLNGAGVRTNFVFDIYVAALYLEKNEHSMEEVIADPGYKRLALHMMYNMGSSALMNAFNDAIGNNLSPAEMEAIRPQLNKFYAIFNSIPDVKKGDVIQLDYIPGVGTRVSVNGIERGVGEGVEVNRALLKIWLGVKPVQLGLKRTLLGG
jgi:hypothetical protein